jgi:hypothetical protein
MTTLMVRNPEHRGCQELLSEIRAWCGAMSAALGTRRTAATRSTRSTIKPAARPSFGVVFVGCGAGFISGCAAEIVADVDVEIDCKGFNLHVLEREPLEGGIDKAEPTPPTPEPVPGPGCEPAVTELSRGFRAGVYLTVRDLLPPDLWKQVKPYLDPRRQMLGDQPQQADPMS